MDQQLFLQQQVLVLLLLLLVRAIVCVKKIERGDELGTVATSSFNATRVEHRPYQFDAGCCVLFRSLKHTGARCFPTFIIVGSMKSGTGQLMKSLQKHPLLRLGSRPGKRELHFFTDDSFTHINSSHISNQNKSLIALSYLQHFPLVGVEDAKSIKTFEKSPDYMRSPHAISLIKCLLPTVKLVTILRDPAVRTLSEFVHHCRHGRYVWVLDSYSWGSHSVNRGDILRVVPNEQPSPYLISNRMLRFVKHKVLKFPCSAQEAEKYFKPSRATSWGSELGPPEIKNSMFSGQLESLLSIFPCNQVKVLVQEDMVVHYNETVASVVQFLALPAPAVELAESKGAKQTTLQRAGGTSMYKSASIVLRNALDLFFVDDLRKLEATLARCSEDQPSKVGMYLSWRLNLSAQLQPV